MMDSIQRKAAFMRLRELSGSLDPKEGEELALKIVEHFVETLDLIAFNTSELLAYKQAEVHK